jgi:eukaryotic-like serine/threonine-protein kinase
MTKGATVGNRYVLERSIGTGGSAVSWLAEDSQTGRRVVVKLLSFSQMEDWKGFELFTREATVLRNLHHPGIPEYLDSFQSGTGKKTGLVLVQQYVEGMNLRDKVASGWRGTEKEICVIAERLIDSVSYIHSLRPPIIHRDINPCNVIVREDGAVFLVDFGGVQDALRVAENASHTVIGTPGYMPMEQFVGRATVRSDLYAVAATILFLLTHTDPQDLPVKDMKIDVASIIDVSPGLAAVLSSWLEPDESKRTLAPETAIRYLQGEAPRNGPANEPVDLQPPRFSRIRAEREGAIVTLIVPERGAAGAVPVLGGFAIAWLAFVGFWTFLTVSMKAWPMPFFSIPFWVAGFFLVRQALKGLFGRTRLRFDPAKGFSFEQRFLLRKSVLVPAAEVGALSMVDRGSMNGRPITGLQFEVGARRFTFAERLSTEEKKWLKKNIEGCLEALRTGDMLPG